MPIPESQLATWSAIGAQAAAKATHESIRAALNDNEWPNAMQFETFLQGSYANHTNIRGNSDVDLVVRGYSSDNNPFYHNLTEEQKIRLNITPGEFNSKTLRKEVAKALTNYYGKTLVDNSSSEKCIIVKGKNGRLTADVIPCLQYRKYNGLTVEARGIAFEPTQGGLIVNYPKLHIQNGEKKNADGRTWGRYKPAVRMFKNARERASSSSDDFSSYFVECLFYNVPDELYTSSLTDSYVSIVNYLTQVELSTFRTQTEIELLFGPSSTQWGTEQARHFINKLAELWNQWSA